MLIKCPECELQVSSKALSCPHCGYPLKQDTASKKRAKRRQRLPNGFGQISHLSNQNLRNPYRAMVTVGHDHNGRPISKLLKPQAYFKTYNEAYAALVEYNKNPYDLEDDLRVYELYERWSADYFKTLKSASSERTITSAWRYCESVYSMRVKDIRARHIKGCMDEGKYQDAKGIIHTPSAGVKARIKSLWNLLLDYAVEYEIVDRNYARTFDVASNIIEERESMRRGHVPFTAEELKILWNNLDVPYVDMILVQCYMGWRPQELCELRIENINLERRSIVGGMKTEAGTNREVPIPSVIYDLVLRNYSSGKIRLFECIDTKTHCNSVAMTYDKYRLRFKNIMESLDLSTEHRAHDCRNTFITNAKKVGMDEYAVKRIVGHSISDITEKVYTQRDYEWLQSEMEKISTAAKKEDPL